MSVTRGIAVPLSAAMSLGLTSCADRRMEDARLSCTTVMQALYRPIKDSEPATFEAVENTARDKDKFEFVWKQGQIGNMLFSLSLADIIGDRGPVDGTYTTIVERAGGERQYICRGSLEVRSLHGIWVRQTLASGKTNDIKVTKYPVSF